ncbi:MAG TPA: GNAT family N-acetyltransferase [Aestuariivirgaceae bacterium]
MLIRFFREEAFSTPNTMIIQHCRALVQLGSCGLFIAESSGQAIGIATVSMQYGIEYGWLGEMDDLYVVPSHRGMGVARELVVAVETFLKQQGASGYQVTLTPHSEKTRGLREFYGKLGFSTEGREIFHREL